MEALRRPGASGLIAGRIPAASGLSWIYADVGTEAGWPLERRSVSISTLWDLWGGDQRYPRLVQQMLSVRTEDPSAIAVLEAGSM